MIEKLAIGIFIVMALGALNIAINAVERSGNDDKATRDHNSRNTNEEGKRCDNVSDIEAMRGEGPAVPMVHGAGTPMPMCGLGDGWRVAGLTQFFDSIRGSDSLHSAPIMSQPGGVFQYTESWQNRRSHDCSDDDYTNSDLWIREGKRWPNHKIYALGWAAASLILMGMGAYIGVMESSMMGSDLTWRGGIGLIYTMAGVSLGCVALWWWIYGTSARN